VRWKRSGKSKTATIYGQKDMENTVLHAPSMQNSSESSTVTEFKTRVKTRKLEIKDGGHIPEQELENAISQLPDKIATEFQGHDEYCTTYLEMDMKDGGHKPEVVTRYITGRRTVLLLVPSCSWTSMYGKPAECR